MILWRISNHVALAGDGALQASGRWHTRGRRVVYCAENPAAALVEILVHFEIEIRDLPARYGLLKIKAPGRVQIERVSLEDLSKDWPQKPEVTRAIGDAWLAGGSAALLRIPSAIVPETFNVLSSERWSRGPAELGPRLNVSSLFRSPVVISTIARIVAQRASSNIVNPCGGTEIRVKVSFRRRPAEERVKKSDVGAELAPPGAEQARPLRDFFTPSEAGREPPSCD